ncbi:MAG TPA: DNA polymerase IV [Candidatus Dormibacteraeota bacterium]|nr:DNA polymerase IV [Candidatus Dormibacteraeota bacterium]
MHVCVENIQDPDVVSQAGCNAPPDPAEADSSEECAVPNQGGSEPINPEPKKVSGSLARWFGFSKSRTGKIANIVHVNLDGFFASVEQVLNPKLRSKPVLVGPGVVVATSYEAKLCGVKIGMTFREALSICPEAIIVPADYACYADFAERVRSILESYTPVVETGNQDDFYLDFAGVEDLYPDYEGTLRRMQYEILCRTGLSVSIGAGRTKVVASTASRLHRRSGLQLVAPGEEEAFLRPLPTEKIHGIGQVHSAMLAKRAITTVGELRRVPKSALQAVFGDAIGKQIWERALGLDGNELRQRSSSECISREATIEGGDFDRERLAGLIRYLSKRVGSALCENGKHAHTVGLRVRYVDDFSVYEVVRIRPSSDEREILDAAGSLFAKLCTRRVPVGLIGVTAKHFDAYQSPQALADKDGQPYLGCGINSVSGGYGWNISRAYG